MKKKLRLLLAMTAVIGFSTGSQISGELKEKIVHASTQPVDMQELDSSSTSEKFKADTTQLPAGVTTNTDSDAIGTDNITRFLRNNADIESKVTSRPKDAADADYLYTGGMDRETYTALIDELMHVGMRGNHLDNKVYFDGEIRYHYASNNGSERWDRDSSGIRIYLGADAALNKDWHAYSVVESKRSLKNYNNEFKLSRLYAVGKVGTSKVKAGSFGYSMAEGNIYDSGFDGIQIEFGGPVQYRLSYGETNDTKETMIATARYEDFDYNLETGVYHYQRDGSKQDTIWTIGGNYNFSNFSVGAMALGSSLKDSRGNSNGYVLSLNYGELKSWRPGSYEIVAKMYNQPAGTYIAHGMNGIGSSMRGFKGYGMGISYTLKENVVAGIEYFKLTDQISEAKGNTWWGHVTYYF